MVIWSNAAGTVIMTNADGSIIDDTQEAFEDCCCEPVIDPDKWYCVNTDYWLNETCSGAPENNYNWCVTGAYIIANGLGNCFVTGPGLSQTMNYIVSGPYNSDFLCQEGCAPV